MGVLEKTRRQARQQGREATRAARPWVEQLARLGYAAKGIVYVVIGVLALQAAQGAGSAAIDKQKALHTILSQPFGQFLLAVIAVGLAGYALWQLVLALADPEHESVINRIGHALTAFSYGGLSYFAYRVMMGVQASSGKASDFTAKVLALPFGRWLVLLAGAAVAILGLIKMYQAYSRKFEQRFKSNELTGRQRRWVIRLGQAGYTARGLVYLVIGIFLVQAALQYNPQRAGGLGEALQALAAQPYGTVVLAATAAGLVAYGLYNMALAQFRRIRPW